jgi:CBS domain-containing protein
MTLHEILRTKGSEVHSISPGATLEDVVQTLVRRNVGSLVVCEHAGCNPPGRMVGIITERDILRACAGHHAPLAAQRVEDVMTCNVITASPGDCVEEAMGLLTQRRIRHLPIMEDDRLVGMISIGDVVKAQHDALSMENHYLKSYIHG